jgi:catechol-2,3-dioxygenase
MEELPITGVGELALEVADLEAVGRLRDQGVDVHEEDFGASRAAYVTDPDGNVVELWTADPARPVG